MTTMSLNCSYDFEGVLPIHAANGWIYQLWCRRDLKTAMVVSCLPDSPVVAAGFYSFAALATKDIEYVGAQGSLLRGSFASTTWQWNAQVAGSGTTPLGNPVALANGDVVVASPDATLSRTKAAPTKP